MLVIYLPEGSVILDRTNIDEKDFPDGVLSAQSAGTVVTAPVAPVEVPVPEDRNDHVSDAPHMRMHLLNLTYVVLVTLVVIVPGLLSSFFGLGIFVARTSAPNAMIYRGDIMISKVLPVFELSANDVFLM